MPRIAFIVIFAIVFGGLMVYPPMRLLTLLGHELDRPLLVALALFALPFITRMLTERWHAPASRLLAALVMTWLGVCFVAFCVLLPAEVLLLFAPPAFDAYTAFTVIGGVAVLSAYGVFNASTRQVRYVSVAAPDALKGKRLAQISDVHIGSRGPALLARIVDELNGLAPDFVVITGDLVDMHGITADDLSPLARLTAPTLFCIGNHERYVDVNDICSRLEGHGVEVLRNADTTIDGIQFLGIDDAERRDQVARHIDAFAPAPDAYRVLLYHRPDGAEAAAAWGADLMLTGHTHRGQIFPFNFLVKRVFPRLYLSYDIEGMHLYVSPGTGTWGPVMRLGSKCEITLFELL